MKHVAISVEISLNLYYYFVLFSLTSTFFENTFKKKDFCSCGCYLKDFCRQREEEGFDSNARSKDVPSLPVMMTKISC